MTSCHFSRIREERCRMESRFTLEYWLDDGWYVGRLKEVPGVFSQGETLEDLESNIIDAYKAVLRDSDSGIDSSPAVKTKDLVVSL